MVDVARAAGVSQKTVSRVINGEQAVSAHTRARVVEAVAQLGYRPHAAARLLAQEKAGNQVPSPAVVPRPGVTVQDVAGRAGVPARTVSRALGPGAEVTASVRAAVLSAVDELVNGVRVGSLSPAVGRERRIGVLAHQLTATGPAGNLAAAMTELREAGYDLDVIPVADDQDDDQTRLAVVAAVLTMARGSCGVLAMAQTETVRSSLLAVDAAVPVYVDDLLDVGPPDSPGAEGLIGQAAAAHLLQRGHRVVAHLPGPHGSLPALNRRQAFCTAVEAAGATHLTWSPGDWSASSGYAVAAGADLGDATAVFVSNDAMAIGALTALAERGVDVPGRMAVLGVDDLPESAFTNPPLTSVRHDLAAEGRLAARVLLAHITDRPKPDPSLHLRVDVRARASTLTN